MSAHLTPHQKQGPACPAEQGGYQAVSRDVTPAEPGRTMTRLPHITQRGDPLNQGSCYAEELLAWALWYAAHGWGVFPCVAGGKRPVPVHGLKDAVTEDQRIRSWWNGRPFNIGVSTGSPGPDVLDVDVRPDGNGWAAFSRLKGAGLLAGAHRLVRTPSGGGHLYFAGTRQRCGSLKGLFVDFKARGGYVLVPPSQVGGRPYEVIDDRPPTGAVLDWEAAKRLLRPPGPVRVRTGRGGSVRHLPDWVAEQGTGNRNKGLYWAACRAAEAGNETVLLRLVDAAVSTGLDRDEALRTVVSAARRVNGDR